MKGWVVGEFATPQAMLDAVRRLRELGYPNLDTHTPYPVEGTSEALGLSSSRVPLLTLIGGLGGATLGYLLQWFCNAWDWPLNVGGRPPHSPPAFVPITFEVGVLLGGFGAFFGSLALMGLPRPHHPIFELDAFQSAAIDHFWVSLEFEATELGVRDPARDVTECGALEVATIMEGRP
jgi:hypothetical protein